MPLSRRVCVFFLLLLMLIFTLACAGSSGASPTSTPMGTLTPRSSDTPSATDTPIPTSTPDTVSMTINSNVNCRKGPSTSFTVVTVLDGGAVVEALGRTDNNGWWYVRNPVDRSSGCWIREDFGVAVGDVSILPVFTAQPAPVVAEPTESPSCKVNSVIHIQNDTGGYITIYLTGPAKFTFNIASGSQGINVCAGQYSYTGYGCGGSALNGTMKAGDKITFYCH